MTNQVYSWHTILIQSFYIHLPAPPSHFHAGYSGLTADAPLFPALEETLTEGIKRLCVIRFTQHAIQYLSLLFLDSCNDTWVFKKWKSPKFHCKWWWTFPRLSCSNEQDMKGRQTSLISAWTGVSNKGQSNLLICDDMYKPSVPPIIKV